MPKAASNKSLPDSATLSIIELQFITQYLQNGLNGTQAYLSVRPDVQVNTAAVDACKLLKRPHVQEYIQSIKDKIVSSSELTKATLIDHAQFGLSIARAKEDIGVLFKGIDTSAKLIGAYNSGEDDVSLYSNLINKISGKNIQINIGTPTNGTKEMVEIIQGESV